MSESDYSDCEWLFADVSTDESSDEASYADMIYKRGKCGLLFSIFNKNCNFETKHIDDFSDVIFYFVRLNTLEKNVFYVLILLIMYFHLYMRLNVECICYGKYYLYTWINFRVD